MTDFDKSLPTHVIADPVPRSDFHPHPSLRDTLSHHKGEG